VLSAVRRTKTEAKVSQRAEVSKLVITADSHTVSILQSNLLDLRNAGSLQEIDFVISESNSELAEIAVQVTLASPLN
jgi:valyl-tRNA synthetase